VEVRNPEYRAFVGDLFENDTVRLPSGYVYCGIKRTSYLITFTLQR
jgi:hypothetical protein